MATSLKPLASGQLPDVETALYTVGAGVEATIVTILLNNVSAADVPGVTLKANIGEGTQQIISLNLKAKHRVVEEERIMLAAGDSLTGVAGTAGAVDYIISGLERS